MLNSSVASLEGCLQILKSSFKSKRFNDVRTAIKTLSVAAGYADPTDCPVSVLAKSPEELNVLIDLNTEGKSHHVIRNTKNNISALRRAALQAGILQQSPSTVLEVVTEKGQKPSRRPGSREKVRYYLTEKRGWPPKLKAEIVAFVQWAESAVVEGRPADQRKRKPTIQNYIDLFSAVFGFLHYVAGEDKNGFHLDLLIDKTTIKRFITWHCNELHDGPIQRLHDFISLLESFARQYRPAPEFSEWLENFHKTIPLAQPVYDKEDGWVSLLRLDEIGLSLWPRCLPDQLRPAARLRQAKRAMEALRLRLWARRPYRSKNIRCMKLKENLYKNDEGQWRIKFVSEEMKVAMKQGKWNYFDLPFPLDLVPMLEDFLKLWHPVLSSKSAGQFDVYLFLNCNGKPYNREGQRQAVRTVVYRYTRKFFHPHLVRSIFATEYIQDTGDFYGAAVLLNDSLKVVIDKYAHLMERGVTQKTDGWLNKKIRTKRPIEEQSFCQANEDLAPVLVETIFKGTIAASLLRKHEALKNEVMKNAIQFLSQYAALEEKLILGKDFLKSNQNQNQVSRTTT